MAQETKITDYKIAKLVLCGLMAFFLNGCTYSIIMNHSEGTASDVVDENQDAAPTISPKITVPVLPK